MIESDQAQVSRKKEAEEAAKHKWGEVGCGMRMQCRCDRRRMRNTAFQEMQTEMIKAKLTMPAAWVLSDIYRRINCSSRRQWMKLGRMYPAMTMSRSASAVFGTPVGPMLPVFGVKLAFF